MKWRQAIYQIAQSNDYKNIKPYEKKDIETIKKDQSEIKNAISEINNTLERINSRLNEAEDQISDVEDKVEKSPRQSSKEKKEF